MKSILNFVIETLRKSINKFSNEAIILQPLFQDTLHKQSVLGSKIWGTLVRPYQSKEFLKKNIFIIPLLCKGDKGIGSVAFVNLQKSQRSIEIFSPSDHENLHFKNSAFYFIRFLKVFINF